MEQIHPYGALSLLSGWESNGRSRGGDGGREGGWAVLAGSHWVNGRICVVGVKANRCARGFGKGNEREWHKWNVIYKKGARAVRERASGREPGGENTVSQSTTTTTTNDRREDKQPVRTACNRPVRER